VRISDLFLGVVVVVDAAILCGVVTGYVVYWLLGEGAVGALIGYVSALCYAFLLSSPLSQWLHRD
jgi:hypothetical protein